MKRGQADGEAHCFVLGTLIVSLESFHLRARNNENLTHKIYCQRICET
jgi:hypothetical protein